MNLNEKPAVDELAQLLAARKDRNDSHILWVSEAGDVHVECLSPHDGEQAFEASRPSMRARLRTYHRGLGYVGKKAAADRDYVGDVLQTLRNEWQQLQGQPGVRVIDRYR